MRELRNLLHQRSRRTEIGEGVPNNKTGEDGDFSLRKTPNGVKLYAKYSGEWHAFTPDRGLDDNRNISILNNDLAMSTNGSLKLTGGFIIQWGTIATSGTNDTETFTTEFPNTCIAVMLVPVEDATTDRWVKLRSKTTSNFVWQVSDAAANINWIALGN